MTGDICMSSPRAISKIVTSVDTDNDFTDSTHALLSPAAGQSAARSRPSLSPFGASPALPAVTAFTPGPVPGPEQLPGLRAASDAHADTTGIVTHDQMLLPSSQSEEEREYGAASDTCEYGAGY